MTLIFPRLVYKDGGPHPRQGGTFSAELVQTQSEYDLALAAGWFGNLIDAVNANDFGKYEPTVEPVPVAASSAKKGKKSASKIEVETEPMPVVADEEQVTINGLD